MICREKEIQMLGDFGGVFCSSAESLDHELS